MRVTNQIVLRNSQSSLQRSLSEMERARLDIASGIRVRRMSDSPIDAARIVGLGSSMRAIEQFRRNITIAETKASAEEIALSTLTDTLSRGLELAIGQVSSAASPESRRIVKAEVDALINLAVGLGNTRVGEEFIFAGTRAAEAPFRVPAAGEPFSALTDGSGDPVNPTGGIPVEIGDGRLLTPTHNGTEAFLDTNALEALRGLSAALDTNDVPGISSSIDALRNAVSSVQGIVVRNGVRVNELESVRLSLGDLELTLQATRSQLRDTAIDQAMIELVGRQTLYQAAMATTSRVLGLSLANYL
jgi:flagellar hook-associated protein 3 FlgL